MLLQNLIQKLPDAPPLIIGGGGAVAVEAVQHTDLTNLAGTVLQIAIALVTIFKMIFPKKEKNQTPKNNN
jgi:hypothetical protein